MNRLSPLPPGEGNGLEAAFDTYRRSLGFVPNSVLIMQRRPKMVAALSQLAASVWDKESSVDLGFKRLVGHMASRAHGCQYCMAHTAGAALRLGVDAEKLDQLWDYQTSPLFSPAERVALDFALAAGSVPNAVDDALFARMRECWSDDDIVEPVEVAEKHLARRGWTGGKHV
jgi:alkylhydroperoxidase family enzyme